jgi:hypothetical protein
MDKKVIAYTEQFGKVCRIVKNGEQINVEETEQECIN